MLVGYIYAYIHIAHVYAVDVNKVDALNSQKIRGLVQDSKDNMKL